MLDVLIVDDEQLMRDGLKNIIPWEEHGFHIPLTAENGIEALELMKREKPDLIITDIRMPFLSGIELLKIITQQSPDIYTVILSGHGEFEYAQHAIQLGASGYLLKPLQKEELLEVLNKIKAQHKRRASPINTLLDIHKRYNGVDAATEDKLREILTDPGISSIPAQLLESFGIGRYDNIAFLAIHIDKIDERISDSNYFLAFQQIENHARSLLVPYRKIIVPCLAQRRILALISAPAAMYEEAADPFISIAQGACQKDFFIATAISNSHLAQDAVTALKEVRAAGAQRASAKSGGTIFFSQIDAEKLTATTTDIIATVSGIANGILSHDALEIDGHFEKLMRDVRSGRITPEFFRSFLAPNVFMHIQKVLSDLKINLEDIFETPLRDYRMLFTLKSVEEMLLSLKAYIETISEFILFR